MWDLHDLHRLQYFDHSDEGRVRGWRSLHITDSDHPYMKHWWVPGLQIGYEHTFIHQVADFLEALAGGKSASPTFREALATDYVTDAVLQSGAFRSLGTGSAVSQKPPLPLSRERVGVRAVGVTRPSSGASRHLLPRAGEGTR